MNGFLFLTQADTDILALSRITPSLPDDFPAVHGYNLSNLRTEEDAGEFLSAVLPGAQVVVLRLLGGRGSFLHGFDAVVQHVRENGKWLVCLPGTDTLDPELTAYSSVGPAVTHQVLAYLQHGGLKNYEQCLRYLSDHLLMTGYGYAAPEPQPRHGVYHPDVPEGSLDAWRARVSALGWDQRPTLGLLFYRSHLLAGNTAFVDSLVRAGEARGANVLPVYAYSLKDYDDGRDGVGDAAPVVPPPRVRERSLGNGIEIASSPLPDPAATAPRNDRPSPAPRLPSALRYFVLGGRPSVDVIISTMSFALGGAGGEAGPEEEWSADVLRHLDVPVLQAITAASNRAGWEGSKRGLTPIDTGINVAIPEFDGRIITVPVSFKEQAPPEVTRNGGAATVSYYAPQQDRVERVIGQALRLAALRRMPNDHKHVAFVLTNYSAKASRIANAVGLDSPASLVRILDAMRAAGYRVDAYPADGDALLHLLIDHGSYDLEEITEAQLAGATARVPAARYGGWFHALPPRNQSEVAERWGQPPGRYYVDPSGELVLAGLEFGNVFVAIQPPRGYGLDPAAIYHLPDLPPPHPYHALYRWLSSPEEAGGWGADAVVHLGKHGTLEWLPGKGIGLSAECYPDLFLGDLPLVYPFIINNPGEGAQAKRRTHAVIVDHLTPPMTTAEGYGELEELTRLVDEYYQMEKLDPDKLPLLQRQIWALIKRASLDSDLEKLVNWGDDDHDHEVDLETHQDGVPHTIADLTGRDFAHLVENINGYLCELTSAQIRDGLHILGVPPAGVHLVDTLLALVRVPNLSVPSLRQGIARCFGLDLDALLDDLGALFATPPGRLEDAAARPLPTHADALEAIDALAKRLVEAAAGREFSESAVAAVIDSVLPAVQNGGGAAPAGGTAEVSQTLTFICRDLVPRLHQTGDEIDNLLHALDGGYVPPGPSGAPTRGMAHILPTGRNFYTVDPRGMPSDAAWQVGQGLAGALLARHLQEEGRYPETVGISIWGTSAMRTHGDDIAEVLALLGVRPRWQPENRRILGFEVIPLDELGRPRIDVICRISGFFRDAFPHLISLLHDAVQAVARLDEPLDGNFVRRHYLADQERLAKEGVAAPEAERLAGYRVFGCKPGTYGAGILPLIDERNWETVEDFAAAYVNWGGYAYTGEEYGTDAREAFRRALSGVQVAVKNQDNREHDIFDSDDYLQYHGGMIATIRALTGSNPLRYFGDSADPGRPKVRDLREEALRVFRTRVVNPKWIESIQRHGYKGALELAATVDYLFGYDATAEVVEDWMYARVAETYALDPAMQAFFRKSNPWALRDIASRLLEAAQRGLWADPGELQGQLQRVYLEADGDIEGRAP